MTKATAADVESAVRRDYPPAAVDGVLALLAAYGVESWERDPEAIRLALVRIVHGDGAQLPQWVEWAKRDWRDVILAVQQTYGYGWEEAYVAELRGGGERV